MTVDHRVQVGPASSSHGFIELIEQRCTSCMICVRECPTWCIRLDSHTEPIPNLAPRARERTRNVLDHFQIDWGTCMYCGICIEECPFDALAWAGSHVPATGTLGELVYDIDRLSPGGRS